MILFAYIYHNMANVGRHIPNVEQAKYPVHGACGNVLSKSVSTAFKAQTAALAAALQRQDGGVGKGLNFKLLGDVIPQFVSLKSLGIYC